MDTFTARALARSKAWESYKSKPMERYCRLLQCGRRSLLCPTKRQSLPGFRTLTRHCSLFYVTIEGVLKSDLLHAYLESKESSAMRVALRRSAEDEGIHRTWRKYMKATIDPTRLYSLKALQTLLFLSMISQAQCPSKPSAPLFPCLLWHGHV